MIEHSPKLAALATSKASRTFQRNHSRNKGSQGPKPSRKKTAYIIQTHCIPLHPHGSHDTRHATHNNRSLPPQGIANLPSAPRHHILRNSQSDPLLETKPHWEPCLGEPDGGYLHAWVDGGAYGAAEGIPYLVVEPVGECVPAVVVEVLGCAEVEVGVEFVYDMAISFNGMKANGVSFSENRLTLLDGDDKEEKGKDWTKH